MKIEFLEKIVGKIQHEIHCPKCKNIFRKGSIEISAVTNQRLEFTSRCHICGAHSQIVADINVKEHGDSALTPIDPSLSPDKVRKIGVQLEKFQGKYIGELFH